ncbi:CPBP family intramembrane glutamic endopeptidase [Paenibacillus methanolicus]|uniref:CAAX prenyl protease 2/Lysostaphin resistance protein A-like domain-containing protein n=1 Tax=Paenibacillus methanolicus TaxID=582686 RepID=A0A5S5C7L9_9BACL|nr:CPBP family intramembrane glutamic endopeptidase [Paenibacillus methanolicus]TYP73983.1 hypothetical protein BCM02_106264 [Paenibacillus methanolicus]
MKHNLFIPPEPRSSAISYWLPALVFLAVVITVQLMPLPAWQVTIGLLPALLALCSPKPHAYIYWLLAAYVIGFGAHDALLEWIRRQDLRAETVVILNRALLACYVIPMLVMARLAGFRPMIYRWIGSLKQRFVFPNLWSDSGGQPIWKVVLIASAINCFIWAFFVRTEQWQQDGLAYVIGMALLFALFNAFFEEWIWRGLVLSRFVEAVGEQPALLFVSACFGAYHYSLGFSWIMCAVLGAGGLFFGGLTLRSKGLLAGFLFHGVVNFWMFMSGMIVEL